MKLGYTVLLTVYAYCSVAAVLMREFAVVILNGVATPDVVSIKFAGPYAPVGPLGPVVPV
jgi:hypothetical protein